MKSFSLISEIIYLLSLQKKNQFNATSQLLLQTKLYAAPGRAAEELCNGVVLFTRPVKDKYNYYFVEFMVCFIACLNPLFKNLWTLIILLKKSIFRRLKR